MSVKSLLKPEPAPKMRVQVYLAGSLAAQVKDLAEEYQTEPATIMRELIVDGLKARKRNAA